MKPKSSFSVKDNEELLSSSSSSNPPEIHRLPPSNVANTNNEVDGHNSSRLFSGIPFPGHHPLFMDQPMFTRIMPIYNEWGFIANLPQFPPLQQSMAPFTNMWAPQAAAGPYVNHSFVMLPPPLSNHSSAASSQEQQQPPYVVPAKRAKPILPPKDDDTINIRFVSFGAIPLTRAQKIGAHGVIPNGYQGEALLFGEQWKFLCAYGQVLLECEDGKERHPISFSLTHQTAGWTVTMEEDSTQILKRELEAETVCDEVLRLALHRRMGDYENNIIVEKARVPLNQAILRLIFRKHEKVGYHAKNSKTFGARLFGLHHPVVQCTA